MLETPEQLTHQYRHPQRAQQERERTERLHQADIAREAAEAREAAQGIAQLVLKGLKAEQGGQPTEDQLGEVGDALFMNAQEAEQARREEEAAAAARPALWSGESTATEREERYSGIMQALDSLGATNTHGASDSEDEGVSPESARLAQAGSEGQEGKAAFDALRHTVDDLGEGDEAAELIMKSYAGRDLEEEALGTMDPSDTTGMPHPGDRYLRPSAARPREAPPGAAAARVNAMHGPDFEPRHGPTLPPARGAASSQGQQLRSMHSRGQGTASVGAGADWMSPSDPSAPARAPHDPVGGPEDQGQGQGQARGPASPPDADRSQVMDWPQPRAGSPGSGDDQIELGGGGAHRAWRQESVVKYAELPAGGAGAADDQIDYEQDAMRGADAMYYAQEHAANPAVNDAGAGWPAQGVAPSGGGNIEGPDDFDVEGDALRGSDSMFYFKAGPAKDGGGSSRTRRKGDGSGKGKPAREEPDWAAPSTVWGALSSRDEEHSDFRRAMEQAAAEASAHQLATELKRRAHTHTVPAQKPPLQAEDGVAPTKRQAGNGSVGRGGGSGGQEATTPQQGILASLRRRQQAKREVERSVAELTGRLHGGRGPHGPKPPAPLTRVLEVALGRSALLGLCAALVSEIFTQQSVVSQLLGRYAGSQQMEAALPGSQVAAVAVLAAVAALCFAERAAGRGQSPFWRPLGLSPTSQAWLGRAAMAAFAALLAYETVHSNRPAFGTLFYLWF